MKQFVTVGGAARRLGVSPDTVRVLARRGVLPALRTESGVRFFDLADVERLARERQHTRREQPR